MNETTNHADLTWEAIERAALYDTVLLAAVTYVRQGALTREAALIYAALALAKIRQDQHETLVESLRKRG